MKQIAVSLLLALCITSVQLANGDTATAEAKRSFTQYSGCVEKENLTMEEVEDYAINGNIMAAESNPKLKCFSACILENTEIIENCKLNDEIFNHPHFPKELQGIFETCKSAIVADERCECGYEFAKCVEGHVQNN